MEINKGVTEVRLDPPGSVVDTNTAESDSPIDSVDIDTAIEEFSASVHSEQGPLAADGQSPSPPGTNSPTPAFRARQNFAEAIFTAYGAELEPIADGEIHRFENPEKRSGNGNCWYTLDPTGKYGVHGDWGDGPPWTFWYVDDLTEVTDEEVEEIKAKVAAARQLRAETRTLGHAETAIKATKFLIRASSADPDYPYLKHKQVCPANARQIGDTLLIPIRNIDGDLRNIQRIGPTGTKRFLPGGEITGCFSLIGCDELPTDGKIYVCEGWATGVTVHEMHGCPVAVALNAGNLPTVCKALREKLPDSVTIIVAADDDRRTKGNPGLTKAIEAGDAIGAEFIRPKFPCTDCDCTDFNDVAACLRGKKADPSDNTPLVLESVSKSVTATSGHPIRLTSALPPVPPFDLDMLPKSFVGFVTDTAKRMQTPPDFLAVSSLGNSSAMVGSKYGIHPKQNDDWVIIPTFWGALVGGPSTLKTACRGAAQKPVMEIERELAKEYFEAAETYKLDTEFAADYLKTVKKKSSELYHEDREKALQDVQDAAFTDPPPTRRRYIFNDATVEKLGELMSENPTGLFLNRDELSGFLIKMAQEVHQGDRAFYLECYDGLNPFIWDRIGRGTVEIERCTLSIVGGIQPSKIATTIQNAVRGTVDDGLIQRFQFAVWPDISKRWTWVDQAPDAEAYARYRSVIRELHELPAPEPGEPGIYLRFSEPAQELYIAWMEQLHKKIRSDTLHPVMQSHLAKMPKTIAGLALLFELIDGGREVVGEKATARALKSGGTR